MEVDKEDITSNIIFSTNSYNFSSFSYKVTNALAPDKDRQYYVFLTASINAEPYAWASVDFIAYLTATNVAYYSNLGPTYYGGWTNVKRTCKFKIEFPDIYLRKNIILVTNLVYSNNSVMSGSEITYQIFFSNSGTSSGRDLTIIDTLPLPNTNYLMLTNDFVTNGYAANFDIDFYNDVGSQIFLSIPSGWDDRVKKIRFSSPNIIPVSGTGVIEYKVKIK